MADYMTFADLLAEVKRAVKTLKGSKDDLIKHIINMVYLDELMVADKLYPLYWMVDFDDSLAAVAPSTITDITKAALGVITVDAVHGLLAAKDIVSIYGIAGMTELNNRTFLVNTIPLTTTLSLIDLDTGTAIDTSGYTAWSSGGTVHHRGKVLATTGKNVQRIIRTKWHGEQPMTEITPEELEETATFWGPTTSRPNRYFHRKKYTATGTEINQLLWFPCSDGAYNLRYWLEMRAAKLVTVGTDVPQLPPQFHPAIVAGAITRLAESNVQVENAVVWPSIYSAQIASLIAFNRKFYDQKAVLEREKPYLL